MKRKNEVDWSDIEQRREYIREHVYNWRKANHEKVKESNRRYSRCYRKAHPEVAQKRERLWRLAHPEKTKERYKRYYQKNSEQNKKRSRRNVKDLTDGYIKKKLRDQFCVDFTKISKDLADELIKQKREQIQLLRMLKQPSKLCINCHERLIYIQKQKLCNRCYKQFWLKMKLQKKQQSKK